jgi:hypothetical protein
MAEPMAVAVHGVLRCLPKPGDKVLIIGAGVIALLYLIVLLIVVWTLAALAFNVLVYFELDKTRALNFLTGYIVERTLSFETPLESLEALLSALDRLLDQLVPLLTKRYQVCGEIRLCFRSEDGRTCPDIVNLKPLMEKGYNMMKERLVFFPLKGKMARDSSIQLFRER